MCSTSHLNKILHIDEGSYPKGALGNPEVPRKYERVESLFPKYF